MSKKRLLFWVGLILFITFLVIPPPEGMTREAAKTSAVALLMICWWIGECIPIYITAFIPVVLFPLLGIATSAETTRNFGHDYVLMLLGGFMLAKGVEQQGLHKHIALSILAKLGTNRKNIVLGFILATALLSMWITNMAVVLIILPIALAIIKKEEENGEQNNRFALALLLAIAYSASIGGTGTLIGTPPNLVFTGMMEKLFPEAPAFSFFEWMKIGIPLLVIFLPLLWFYIIRFYKIEGSLSSGSIIETEIKQLGGLTVAQKRVLLVFIITALGWIFRRDFMIDDTRIPGWGSLLGVASYVHDSTVAMLGAIMLFVLSDGKKGKLLSWKVAQDVPWGVAMFLGGGLALGYAVKTTGLTDWLGESLKALDQLPGFVLIFVVVTAMIFITEVNSNTATATIFLPVLAAIGGYAGINPLVLMIPATFACSFAFMLPTGTGTNTVIFASERLTIPDMVKAGFWFNIICIIVLPMVLYYIIFPIAGIDSSVPEWLTL